jgi:MoxR-like ATPase
VSDILCYYTGLGEGASTKARAPLPTSRKHRYQQPSQYVAEPDLRDATNVALALGQPLLLTGEPGTGKTQLAYSLAWELGLGDPLKFETKSTSTAKDLFYTYDVLGRFTASKSHGTPGKPDHVLSYVRFNALGKAILLANPLEKAQRFITPGVKHEGPRRSVVLIDEVDKAPRDFPNDLLNEIEGMYFRFPELDDSVISAPPAMHPIVIITSNSEKSLPDAFLRRCVYYNIPFPDRPTVERIVVSRVGELAGGGSEFLSLVLDLFFGLRTLTPPLRKKPATAELLNWIVVLREAAPDASNPLRTSPALALQTLSSFIKTAEDRPAARGYIQQQLKIPTS